MSTNSLTTCCESSSRTLAETGAAASAQTPVYCPVYESRLLATARHELNSAAALGVYGGPYAGPQGYGNYVTYGTEAPAFYSLVSRPGGCSLPPSLPPARPPAPRCPRAPGGGGRSAGPPPRAGAAPGASPPPLSAARRSPRPAPRTAAVPARRSLLTVTQLKVAPDELAAECGEPGRPGSLGRPSPSLRLAKKIMRSSHTAFFFFFFLSPAP